MLAGDLILLDTHANGTVNHTQVVTSHEDYNLTIMQGNFVSDWQILLELRTSEDPSSDRYIGTYIQQGMYNDINGNYTRNGEVTEGLLFEDTTYGRSWDFQWFNEYKAFDDYFKSEGADKTLPETDSSMEKQIYGTEKK